MIEYFKNVNNAFWEGSKYQFLFYIGIVLVLIIEKRRTVKSILAAYPLLVLIGLFNPVSYKVITTIFTWDLINYYRRFFAMIPIFYCIAYGLTILIKNSKDAIKLVFVCMACFVVIIWGKNIYKESWMEYAKNASKVPYGVIDICEVVNDEEEMKSVATPGTISTYIRQVNPNLITPYGRYPNELGTQLLSVDPDVDYVIEEASREYVDYVVLYDSDLIRNKFSDKGYSPYATVGGYVIYNISGIPRVRRFFNRINQVERTVNYNGNDEIINNDEGYAIVEKKYNSKGDLIKEEYFDSNNNLINTDKGYCTIKKEYNSSGRLLLSWFYNKDGELLDFGSGYFHNYLQSLKNRNVSIIISVKDDASTSLTPTIMEDFKSFGLNEELDKELRYSYCAVISPDAVQEVADTNEVNLSGTIGTKEYQVSSAGFDAGNKSSIIFDGEEYSKNERGLNIVVIEDDKVIDSFACDTYSSDYWITR